MRYASEITRNVKENPVMIISMLAAMTAGYLLSVMIGTPKAISATRLCSLLCEKLAPSISAKYQDSEDGQHTAGTVYMTVLILFALIPAAVILLLLYRFCPAAAIIVDAVICWSVMDIKSVNKLSAAAARSARSHRFDKVERAASALNGTDCSDLTDEELIKASVQGVADRTVDNAAAPLFYNFLLGGVGGLLFRMIDTAAELCPENTDAEAGFAEPLRKAQAFFLALPGKLASVIMLVDALFLKLNTRDAEYMLRRDGKKCRRACFGGCRAVLAGLLGISLVPEEVYSEQFIRTLTIGDGEKEPVGSDITLSAQLMNGTAFLLMLLFFMIKLTIGVWTR